LPDVARCGILLWQNRQSATISCRAIAARGASNAKRETGARNRI
jgi:hypothetical protein